MTIGKMMEVLKTGDNKGSALKELAKFYHCDDYDLSPINDAMADSFIKRQRCSCYEDGHWYLKDCGTCNGTKDREPCKCAGNRTKCDFYSTTTNTNGVIKMTSETTGAIRAYSRDENQSESLLALLDFYGKTRLMDISEEEGLYFLQKLKDGEIRLYTDKLL